MIDGNDAYVKHKIALARPASMLVIYYFYFLLMMNSVVPTVVLRGIYFNEFSSTSFKLRKCIAGVTKDNIDSYFFNYFSPQGRALIFWMCKQ